MDRNPVGPAGHRARTDPNTRANTSRGRVKVKTTESQPVISTSEALRGRTTQFSSGAAALGGPVCCSVWFGVRRYHCPETDSSRDASPGTPASH